MKNPLFVMSLSGTLAFLLYKAFYPLARKYFRPGWRYMILKVVLAFYLMPLPLLLNWIWGAIKKLTDRNDPNIMKPAVNFTEKIVVYANTVVNSTYFSVLLYVSIGFGFISLFMICFQIRNYIMERRKCLRSGYDLPCERFQREADTVRCKQNVRFMASPQARTPFTIGVLKPVVILPIKMLEADGETTSMCVIHELTHIRTGDLIYRLLTLTAVCIHWFNPICHWFQKELIVVSEICCDYNVLGTISRSQRKVYYDALLSVTDSPQPPFHNNFLPAFANDRQRELQRRILELEVIDHSKHRLPAVFACAAILLVGMLSALAYAPPVVYNDPILDRYSSISVFDPNHSSIDDFPTFAPTPTQTDQEQAANNDLTILDPNTSVGGVSRSLPFASYVADANGTVYEAVLDVEDPDCVHQFVPVTLVEHVKLSDGKCATAYYKCQRCIVCGFTVQGAPIFQTSPEKCGHVFTD